MKIEKNKIVFVAVLAVVILFLICYTIMLNDEDSDNHELEQTTVPKLESDSKEYQSKLDALNDLKEVRKNTAPSIYDESLLDSLGYYDPQFAEKEKQRIVDSIYQGNQIQYEPREYAELGNSTKDVAPRPVLDSAALHQELQVATQEMGLQHQLFFAGATSTSLKKTPVDATTNDVLHAVVDGDQVVKANSRIRLRLTSDNTINGVALSKNTLIFGTVSFQPNRALISIESVNHQAVPLQAYDLQDGLEGIYIENNFRAQASREVFDDVLQDVNIPSLPQVSGISQLLRRDNRNVKVTVLNNYKLLLKAH